MDKTKNTQHTLNSPGMIALEWSIYSIKDQTYVEDPKPHTCSKISHMTSHKRETMQ
ncbi:hypothetical protein DPMN_031774 [Dreissena polymorpha]|uniref:Uncharacterized protein n=1 Tax=Dreissena polymorpha TaxID=45954 RepID=A0A9D4M342_DREPO|nr:hypothetical protein DPMN_031774 [Dreissena polymorpha]